MYVDTVIEMCSAEAEGVGNGKEWIKAAPGSAPKLRHSVSGCINYISAGCLTIPIS